MGTGMVAFLHGQAGQGLESNLINVHPMFLEFLSFTLDSCAICIHVSCLSGMSFWTYLSFHYSLSTWAVPGHGSIKFVCLQLAGAWAVL